MLRPPSFLPCERHKRLFLRQICNLSQNPQPTIGNPDAESLTCWYGKMQTFLKEFMKDISNFCKATISKLAKKIKETENELTQLLEKEIYEKIK